MRRKFSIQHLEDIVTNVDLEPMPFITTSALIQISELEEFLKTAKSQEADCFRFYFVRYKPDEIPTPQVVLGDWEVEGCKWETTSNGLTQGSIAIVAAKYFANTKDLRYTAEDIVVNNEVDVLMPGIEESGSALNPRDIPACSAEDSIIMLLQSIILFLPIITVGIAAFTSLISFYRDYPPSLKKVSMLWVINFLTDLAGNITRYYNIHNNWIYNIWYYIFFGTVALFYKEQINNHAIRKSIQYFSFIFPILILLNCYTSGIQSLQAGVIVCGGVFIIFLAAVYFRQLYISEENVPISRDPWFWFSFGLITFLGGSVPFLGMLRYLFELAPNFTRIYYLYFVNALNVFLNVMIIVGFLCLRNYPRRLY